MCVVSCSLCAVVVVRCGAVLFVVCSGCFLIVAGYVHGSSFVVVCGLS